MRNPCHCTALSKTFVLYDTSNVYESDCKVSNLNEVEQRKAKTVQLLFTFAVRAGQILFPPSVAKYSQRACDQSVTRISFTKQFLCTRRSHKSTIIRSAVIVTSIVMMSLACDSQGGCRMPGACDIQNFLTLRLALLTNQIARILLGVVQKSLIHCLIKD